MHLSPPSKQFVQELTANQARLLAYVMTLLPNLEAAQDVLQNTNLVLWEKAETFTEGTNFLAWACAVARHEVLAYYRRTQRERHVFDEALVEQLATTAERHHENTGRLSLFLDQCLALRSTEEQELLRERYASGGSVTEMAARRGLAPGQVSVLLCRLRHKLLGCIERKLAAVEVAPDA